MNNIQFWCSLCLGGFLAWNSGHAHALPGQPVDDVVAWIQAHPTLRPAPGETLLVRKSDTPARRFTFQAFLTPPGRALASNSQGTIRSEQITLVDLVNGITRDRLVETLRIIYSVDIAQDYDQSVPIHLYPMANEDGNAQPSDHTAPLPNSLQGEIRQGDRFAYWLELTQNAAGITYTGRITIFLRDDIGAVIAGLSN